MSVPGASLAPPSRPPRVPRRRSLRAWLLSQPRVRRWLTIRRWPPLFLAGVCTSSLTDSLHDPRWQLDLVASGLDISIIVIALSVDAYLSRRARRLVGLRSRVAYLAMAAGPLALAVACIYVAAVRLIVRDPRLGDLFTLIGGLSAWTALLALGRALTWGRLRRLCWIYPPAGRPSPAER